MIMYMCFVIMCSNYKLMIAFSKSHSQLAADSIGILRCDFSWFEALPYLVSEHFILTCIKPCYVCILPLG